MPKRTPCLYGGLKSVVAGRQFPQQRCHKAGWTKHGKCMFCVASKVLGTKVKTKMPNMKQKRNATAAGEDKGEQAPIDGSTSNTTPPDVHTQTDKATLAKLLGKVSPDIIGAAPAGTLRHRNYCCPSLEPERDEHAPSGFVYKANLSRNSDLGLERALMPSILHRIPPPPPARSDVQVDCGTPRWNIQRHRV